MSRNRSPLTDYNREVIRPGPRRGMRVVLSGGSTSSNSVLIKVGSSNTLYTGGLGTIYGANYNSSAIANVPVATPVSTANAYSNGLCYANLINADGTLGSVVWLINAPISGGSTPAITINLPAGFPVVGIAAAISIAGGGTVTAYQPLFA
jgi:hypothetical protein